MYGTQNIAHFYCPQLFCHCLWKPILRLWIVATMNNISNADHMLVCVWVIIYEFVGCEQSFSWYCMDGGNWSFDLWYVDVVNLYSLQVIYASKEASLFASFSLVNYTERFIELTYLGHMVSFSSDINFLDIFHVVVYNYWR